MKRFFVYILASRKNGTLYTGVTNDMARRAFEHRSGAVEGFTARHPGAGRGPGAACEAVAMLLLDTGRSLSSGLPSAIPWAGLSSPAATRGKQGVPIPVTPAQAGVQGHLARWSRCCFWIPAFAGMTGEANGTSGLIRRRSPHPLRPPLARKKPVVC